MKVVIKKRNQKPRDESASLIAELFGVTDSYVRKVAAGTFFPKKEAAQKKAVAIKQAYDQYVSGKTNLIKSIEKTVKVA